MQIPCGNNRKKRSPITGRVMDRISAIEKRLAAIEALLQRLPEIQTLTIISSWTPKDISAFALELRKQQGKDSAVSAQELKEKLNQFLQDRIESSQTWK